MTALTEAMREALRLTRTGSLRDATRIIQLALRTSDGARDDRADVAARSGTERATPASTLSMRAALPALPAPQRDDGPASTAPEHRPQGRFVPGRYAGAAGSRSYKLWLPRTREDASRPALVVMLHGCTQDADDFARGTRMNEHGDRHGCHVLYPSQDGAANAQRCWRWFDPAHQQRDQGEPAILAGMTRQIVQDNGIDPGRVYVAGLSAGGAMALVLASTYPEVFAAVAVHSGLARGAASDVPSALAAMAGRSAACAASNERPVPGIVFHGEADRTVRPSNGDQVVQQLQQRFEAGGTRLTRRIVTQAGHTTTTFHTADGRVLIEHWRVKDGGHAWFGGAAAGSHTAPSAPDASARLVEFFLAQPRNN